MNNKEAFFRSVPGEKDLFFLLIIECERKHSPQLVQETWTGFLICMDKDLSISLR